MPVFPLHKKGMANTVIRMPFEKLRRRSALARPADKYRGYRNER